MKKYNQLFWDLDGTLLDSFEGCSNSFNAVFDYFKLDIPKSEHRKYIGPPLRTTFAKLISSDEKVVEKAVEVYREHYLNGGGQWQSKLFDGIKEALEIIKSMGYKMYVATSKGEGASVEILQKYGVAHIFDRIFGADYRKGRVEKEDVLMYAFDELACSKDTSLMIGDSIYDVMGAKHIGIDCLACTYGFGDINQMRKEGIVGECDSPAELIRFFEK